MLSERANGGRHGERRRWDTPPRRRSDASGRQTPLPRSSTRSPKVRAACGRRPARIFPAGAPS